MVAETGSWLVARGVVPSLILTTPTVRTRQTVDELALLLPSAPCEVRGELPESRDDWDALVDPIARRLGPYATLLMVGHHPTLHFLADAFGPPPEPIPRQNFAAALVLLPGRGGWTCEAAWPGRAG